MRTISDIIDVLGGTSAFSRAIDVKQSAGSEMKRRNSIPVQYWPKLIRAGEGLDAPLTYEELVSLHVREDAA